MYNQKGESRQEEDNETYNNNFSIYPIANFIQSLNRDIYSKKLLENYEKNSSIKFSDSNNVKLLKQIGHALNGFEEIFKINDNTFSRYQEEMENLNNLLNSNGDNSDINLTNITTINIYLRISDLNFKESEILKKEISIDNLESIRIPFIEFDDKFIIVKKYTIGELKFKACNSFNILNEDYIILTKNFEWILFNVDLYQEIFLKNVRKGYIENTSRFFQMNGHITVNEFR